jgi:hypothetical protein
MSPPRSSDSSDTKIPQWGYVKGLGRCRVLCYLGNDRFELLTRRDERYRVHRDRISFRK